MPDHLPGSEAGHPLRVAVVGSGPAGFYAAEHLLKQPGLHVVLDMYEMLPMPFGLVRYGVAPDHQKIKSVTKAFESVASRPNFRLLGNVEVGRPTPHLGDPTVGPPDPCLPCHLRPVSSLRTCRASIKPLASH